MSNEALLQNAKQVLSEHRLEDVRREIENAKYYFGLITDKDIFLEKLIWMGPPDEWKTYTSNATPIGKIYAKLAPHGKSRSLGNIAKRIRLNYSGNTPEQLLAALHQESKWFGRHLSFSTHFDPLLTSPLWVRTLRDYEKEAWGEPKWQDKLYIEDGNHRALVFAIRILCGSGKFIPVPVLWCKSWKHILYWAADSEEADQDLPPSQLEKYFERDTVDNYLPRFKNLSEL